MIAAVLVSDGALRNRIADALRGRATPRFLDDGVQFEKMIGRDAPDCIIAELNDSSGASVLSMLRVIHARFPSRPVLACCQLEENAFHLAVQAGRLGLTDVVLIGFDDVGGTVRSMLDKVESNSARYRVASAFRRIMPPTPSLHEFVGRCLEAPPGPARRTHAVTVNYIAGQSHISRRTLAEQFHRASVPSPHTVLAWVRLLTAACLLNDPGRSIASTAHDAGFASARALRRTMKQMTGFCPGDVRGLGGFRCVLRALRADVQSLAAKGQKADYC